MNFLKWLFGYKVAIFFSYIWIIFVVFVNFIRNTVLPYFKNRFYEGKTPLFNLFYRKINQIPYKYNKKSSKIAAIFNKIMVIMGPILASLFFASILIMYLTFALWFSLLIISYVIKTKSITGNLLQFLNHINKPTYQIYSIIIIIFIVDFILILLFIYYLFFLFKKKIYNTFYVKDIFPYPCYTASLLSFLSTSITLISIYLYNSKILPIIITVESIVLTIIVIYLKMLDKNHLKEARENIKFLINHMFK